jgi:hypothetical protein
MRELGIVPVVPETTTPVAVTVDSKRPRTAEKLPPPALASDSSSVECPVCGRRIRTDLEQHVEECLNRQAIKALLKETRSEETAGGEIRGPRKPVEITAKRKLSAAENPPKKQRKSSNTIDAYFKR